VVARQDSKETDDFLEEEDEYEEDEEEEMPTSTPRGKPSHFSMPSVSKISAIPIGTFAGSLDDLVKSGKMIFGNSSSNEPRMGAFTRASGRFQASSPDPEDIKLGGVLSALIEARGMKRHLAAANEKVALTSSNSVDGGDTIESNQSDANSTPDQIPRRALIMMVRDYKEIQATGHGSKALQMLHDQVRARRKAGHQVILIGTVSSADMMPSLSKGGIRSIQGEYEDGMARTIIVTPPRGAAHDGILAEDESRRMREINMRHLQDIIRRRTPDAAKTAGILSQSDLRLDSSLEFSSGLHESVWSFDRVHRVAVTALGLMGSEDELTADTIEKALRMLDASDEVKFDWASEERQQQKSLEQAGAERPLASAPVAAAKESEDKLKRIRKTCNAHEKKLLSGVINPGT
jgi:hypothetical protein